MLNFCSGDEKSPFVMSPKANMPTMSLSEARRRERTRDQNLLDADLTCIDRGAFTPAHPALQAPKSPGS